MKYPVSHRFDPALSPQRTRSRRREDPRRISSENRFADAFETVLQVDIPLDKRPLEGGKRIGGVDFSLAIGPKPSTYCEDLDSAR